MRTAKEIIIEGVINVELKENQNKTKGQLRKEIEDDWNDKEGKSVVEEMTNMINLAREEAIKECAERAKIIWIDDDYNEELRDMNRHAEIDKYSILNIIKELK